MLVVWNYYGLDLTQKHVVFATLFLRWYNPSTVTRCCALLCFYGMVTLKLSRQMIPASSFCGCSWLHWQQGSRSLGLSLVFVMKLDVLVTCLALRVAATTAHWRLNLSKPETVLTEQTDVCQYDFFFSRGIGLLNFSPNVKRALTDTQGWDVVTLTYRTNSRSAD